jgi:hypothetical protein
MYALKAVLIFLASFVVLVIARPSPHGHLSHHHHHRRSVRHTRRNCRAQTTPIIVAAAPEQTHKSNVVASDPGPVPGNGSSSSSSATRPAPSSNVSNKSGSGSDSSSDGGGGGRLSLDALFPVSDMKASWTTSPLASDPLPLSDSTLKPTNLLSALPHPYVNAPDGKRAMKAHYPQGSYTFTHQPQGGISFYAPGAIDLTTAKEATFGYSVYFEDGFDFQKGGKLPGLCKYGWPPLCKFQVWRTHLFGLDGGDDAETAIGCSGGRRSAACFSARLMWRAAGAGELYTYLPPYTESQFAANRKQCDVPPYSECNPTYGASVGRGSFTFATGQWTTVSQRVRLNDPNTANGELELFANGKSVVKVDGLILRSSDAGKLRGIQMQTFFGGMSRKAPH